MKAKQIHIGTEARAEVIEGISITYGAVASTLGPHGRTVVIENDIRKDNAPTVTKDGVSVAAVINLPKQLNQLGARLVLQASTQADTKSGDGTTTTVVLAHGLVSRAMEQLNEGMLPIQIRENITRSVENMVGYLQLTSAEYEVDESTIQCVARISANGEETLSKVAISAIEAAKGGPVAVKSHREELDELEVLTGAILPGAPLTIDLIDRNLKITTVEQPLVAIYNGRLTSAAYTGFYDHLQSLGHKDRLLIIVAKDLEDGVEQLVAAGNDHRGNRTGNHILVVPSPGAGAQRQRYLGLLSSMIGAPVIEPGNTIQSGYATAVQIEAKRVSLIPNEMFPQDTVVAELMAERATYSVGSIKYRQSDEILRFVLGRRVTVYVGGMTEADIKERQDRMVDAVHAIEAARDGVIPGGGTVLAMAAMSTNDEYRDAYTLPFRKILLNGGITETDAMDCLRQAYELGCNDGLTHTYFYDILKEEYVNLVKGEMPVYDPVRVTINALRAAAQVAITVISSNCYIIED